MNGIIWLASYPKSGNTWMRLVLYTLRLGRELNCLDDVGDDVAGLGRRVDMDRRLGLSTADLTHQELIALRPAYLRLAVKTLAEPTLFKTHDAYLRLQDGSPQFPLDVTLGAVVILRDPRDVAVSYAQHCSATIDKTIAVMADPSLKERSVDWRSRIPEFRLGWSAHAASWLDAPDLRRLVIRYEDMLADPIATFTAAAAFAGLPHDPERVRMAVDATRFERLHQREQTEGFKEKMGGDFFFRQGRAGGWRTVLTPAQEERLCSDHGPMMRRLGYLS